MIWDAPAVLFTSLVAVAFFALTLAYCGLAKVGRKLTADIGEGVTAITDSELDDETKEQKVQQAGLAVIVGSWSIFWRISACLASAAAPILVAHWLSLADQYQVFDLILTWEFIVLVTVVSTILWLILRLIFGKTDKQDQQDEEAIPYQTGDRLLHMLVFGSNKLMRGLARIDDKVFGVLRRSEPVSNVVFVTSLARGGTTALLNALSSIPAVATHTYRDMPLITAPYLWHVLSKPFPRKVEVRERAHGDGLTIGLDSPEAFDEVYWKLYWPDHYDNHSIRLWQVEEDDPKGILRLAKGFEKIVSLRGAAKAVFVSKNNAMIARLRMLPTALPQAKVVIVLRQPAQHAASLLRQHENFSKMQAQEPFVQRYMRDIGHFEFGLIHKHIAFPGFDASAYSAESPDYWLAYWIAAFQEVQANLGNCLIVLQDDLRSQPGQTMTKLLQHLQVETQEPDFSTYFRTGADETDDSVFSDELLQQARDLYQDLARQSV